MTTMFGKHRFALAIFAIVLGGALPNIVRSAEPMVEINSAPTSSTISSDDVTSDQSSILSIPHLPLTLSAFVHGGYDDNFRTSQPARGSWFTDQGLNLAYTLPGKATYLNLNTGVDFVYYLDGTSGRANDINVFFDGSLIRHVSRRLYLSSTVYVAYRTEPDFGSNVGLDTRQGNYLHSVDKLSVGYHWTQRFETVTSGTFQLVQYDSNSTQTESLNRVEGMFGEELKYDLFHAGNTLVGEYRFQLIDYDTAPRDSLTHFALAGINQDFTPYLKLIARGGATFRSYTDDGSQTNPHFEGSLTYSGPHHSSLSWQASYGIEEPSADEVLNRTTFRTGLEYKYGLTDKITTALKAYYHHDDNKGTIPSTGTSAMPTTGFTEDAFDVSLDLRYAINRHFSFELNFERSQLNSQQAGRDYSRYRGFGGISFTY